MPLSLFTPVDFSVELPSGMPRLSHADPLLLLGSCFATHMGTRLAAAKFRCVVNPYGVLYNPLSIATALREIRAGKEYAAGDLFEHRGCWHSPMHHGDFSSPDREETLRRINDVLRTARAQLAQVRFLLLTFGTAWVYEQADSRRVVGNCHRLPEKCFTRRRLEVEEIVEEYVCLLGELWAENPALQVLLTVSPIRHVRDGLHANQLSKAVLLLAADRLRARFPEQVFYFPAYELLMDELRDYRFYADDLVHPSATAVEYVWERFATACFTAQTRQVMKEVEEVGKALAHRPLHPDSEEYKRFLGQIVLKIERLTEKYPYLDFQKEKESCHIRLNALPKS